MGHEQLDHSRILRSSAQHVVAERINGRDVGTGVQQNFNNLHPTALNGPQQWRGADPLLASLDVGTCGQQQPGRLRPPRLAARPTQRGEPEPLAPDLQVCPCLDQNLDRLRMTSNHRHNQCRPSIRRIRTVHVSTGGQCRADAGDITLGRSLQQQPC